MSVSRTQKRLVVGALAAILAVGGGAFAFAGVPKTFNSGGTLTAADLNANFSDLDSRLAAVTAWVSAHYHIATNQFLPTGAFPPPYTVINFDAKDWDSADAVTTGASWKFKAPVAGKYLATVSLIGQQSASPPINTAATIRFAINGNLFAGPAIDQRFDYGITNMSLSGSDVLQLAANDVVAIEFASDTAGQTFNVGSTGGAVSFTRISD